MVYQDERLLFFGALSLLCFVFILYTYFVSLSVVHVVMRKEVSNEITELSSYVGQLESQYIEAQHAMSEDIASLDGFVRTDEKVFIERTPASLVLSFETDGS